MKHSAFPFQASSEIIGNRPHYGLTKREYATIHVLAGICANPNSSINIDDMVKDSIKMADELLRQAGEVK